MRKLLDIKDFATYWNVHPSQFYGSLEARELIKELNRITEPENMVCACNYVQTSCSICYYTLGY